MLQCVQSKVHTQDIYIFSLFNILFLYSICLSMCLFAIKNKMINCVTCFPTNYLQNTSVHDVCFLHLINSNWKYNLKYVSVIDPLNVTFLFGPIERDHVHLNMQSTFKLLIGIFEKCRMKSRVLRINFLIFIGLTLIKTI